jgi:hypothetical protein
MISLGACAEPVLWAKTWPPANKIKAMTNLKCGIILFAFICFILNNLFIF